jgi:toxin-antitoxin system PIN domain toxin
VSFAVDVNILLYASDQSSPFGERASAFLFECAEGSEVVYVAWPTIFSYLRVATHAGVFANPLTPDDAMENVSRLLALPHIRTLSEDDGFWTVYRDVARMLPVRGNLVPDAHLAALLRQHGVTTLYTNDVDFRKFTFLTVINPFERRS